MTQSTRNYRDLHEHLHLLEKRGLLRTIDRPIDKDSELHPLVRWQFVGGLDEDNRKAFLFTNVTDGLGRKYDIPVLVGAIAANPQIYSVGMDAEVADMREEHREIEALIGKIETGGNRVIACTFGLTASASR